MTEYAGNYDVVVIGGGSAGLSGALILGRARRSVLVVDSQQPRNAPAAHMHGLLSRDGLPPEQLLKIGRTEIAGYGAEVVTGQAVSAAAESDGFAVKLDSGRTVHARRLLVATGMIDVLPEIPGLADRWGRDVLHCPYCHGWEVRDQRVGVLATSAAGLHQAMMFRQLTDKLTLLLHTTSPPSEEVAEELAARDIRVVSGEVSALKVVEDRLTGVRLHTGEFVPLDALAVGPRCTPRASVLSGLGVHPTAHPRGMGEHIAADPTGLTEVPGVWVAGNVAEPYANVLASVAAGSNAAFAINADLIAEDTRLAVRARRAPFSRATEAQVSELVLGARRHGV